MNATLLYNEYCILSVIYFYFYFTDKPQPPEELKIDKITPENVTISWSPPKDDGGSPVTEYIIEKRDMKRSTWSPAGTTSETTFTVPKLLEGNSYKFRVRAKNEQGPSEPAETSEPVIAKHQFGKWRKACVYIWISAVVMDRPDKRRGQQSTFQALRVNKGAR